jgi:4,5:9,10-diseco-3-hydroxy-5,9,17-trioxoandrosta-1(10),2-diene-4-oate hydrolase
MRECSEYTYETTSRRLDGSNHLHYHDAGSGPPLLMLHGSGPGVSGWSNFQGNLPTFAQHFRTLVVDQPGFGRSYHPTLAGPYHEVSIDAIVRLLDELDVDRVHVLGNSLGGRIAAELALAHPARVDRLVLMGPGGLGVNTLSPNPSEGMQRLMEFNESPTKDLLYRWLKSMVADASDLTEELVDERYSNIMRPGALEWSRTFFRALFDPALQTGPPLWARASHVRHRTLLTWGRDDRVIPLEHALMPLRQLPNVELHVFSQCGHWAMIERKKEFEGVVLEFLTRQ